MGCNGSKTQDIKKERARVKSPSEVPATPQIAIHAADGGNKGVTPNVQLPRPGTSPSTKPAQGMSVRGFGGMSHTDRKQREQEDFLSVVQRARKDFIDVSAHSHTNAQPLSKAAVDRHKKYQSYLATTPVANLGFFATDFPRSVFSSEKGLLDPNGEAAALAIEALTHPALDADMGEQVIRRAQIVASVVTEILPLVPPESLVITCDQFAEDLESTEA